MAHTSSMLDKQGYLQARAPAHARTRAHMHTYVIFLLSHGNSISRMRLNVMLYVHCLYCFNIKVRLIAIVMYSMIILFNHSIYFVLPKSLCILLKCTSMLFTLVQVTSVFITGITEVLGTKLTFCIENEFWCA